MIRQQDCPICGQPVSAEPAQQSTFFPFCSERCRNVDLLRWAKGRYSIVEPADPAEFDALDEPPAE